jgi:hypothetical protein
MPIIKFSPKQEMDLSDIETAFYGINIYKLTIEDLFK